MGVLELRPQITFWGSPHTRGGLTLPPPPTRGRTTSSPAAPWTPSCSSSARPPCSTRPPGPRRPWSCCARWAQGLPLHARPHPCQSLGTHTHTPSCPCYALGTVHLHLPRDMPLPGLAPFLILWQALPVLGTRRRPKAEKSLSLHTQIGLRVPEAELGGSCCPPIPKEALYMHSAGCSCVRTQPAPARPLTCTRRSGATPDLVLWTVKCKAWVQLMEVLRGAAVLGVTPGP